MDRPTSASLMICDGCGFSDSSLKPNVTAQELIDGTAETLTSLKQYFEDAGWYVSLGYDLCPSCRELKNMQIKDEVEMIGESNE